MLQNEACVCGLGPLSATSLGVLTSWERKDGADYGEFLPPPVVIAVVPTLETHWHLASSRMTRQVLEPAQVSLGLGNPRRHTGPPGHLVLSHLRVSRSATLSHLHVLETSGDTVGPVTLSTPKGYTVDIS